MYSTEHRIRYSECGASGRIKVVNIFHYLQDAADDHALSMGVSAGELQKNGFSWVLYRYGLKILRYPIRGESINIRTWPCMYRNLYEMRAFVVTDDSGGLLFEAKTCWLVIDLEKGNPVRLNRTPYADILKGGEEIPFDIDEIPELGSSYRELGFRVRFHDLDTNRHVNNAIYPEWAIESVPEWAGEKHDDENICRLRPWHIEINYKSAAHYGDTVLCRSAIASAEPELAFVHSIRNKADGRELARLRTSWKAFG